MKENRKDITTLYTSDEYIAQNPTLFQGDSPWKVSKIVPLVNELMKSHISENKTDITILDVGGGAGLILNSISEYFTRQYQIKVHKNVLDLSPGMLAVQKNNNPDIERALEGDIRKTPFGNKTIDVTLMIDVLEHVPEPSMGLQELMRISKFVIIKVPLDDILLWRLLDFTKRAKKRKGSQREHGHINHYNVRTIKESVRKHCGRIIFFSYTNVFDYELKSKGGKLGYGLKLRLVCYQLLNKICPRLVCCITLDYAMLLVKCYE